jgi:hypothetical protein
MLSFPPTTMSEAEKRSLYFSEPKEWEEGKHIQYQ